MVQLHRPTAVEAGASLNYLTGQVPHTPGLGLARCRYKLLAPYHHSQPGVHEQHIHTSSCMPPTGAGASLPSGAAQPGWDRQHA